jgi:hypothetical protein
MKEEVEKLMEDVYEIPVLLGHKGIEWEEEMYLSVLRNNMNSTTLKSTLKSIRSTIRDKKIDQILD